MPARTLIAFLLALLLLLAAPVQAADVALVLSRRGGAYDEFATALQRALEGQPRRISTVVMTPESLGDMRSTKVWVTVGSEAARAVLERGAGPSSTILATMLTRRTFENLLSESGGGRQKGGVTALVLDQPLERQVHMVSLLLPEKKRLGILVGPQSRFAVPRLQQMVGKYGLTLEVEEVKSEDSVVPAANRLLSRSDVLLALPDLLVYHRNHVRPILLASYYHQRPVIGYSSAFVDAGALAALYSTPDQMARQVVEIVHTDHRALPLILPPDNLSLAYNRHLAQSLGIDLPDPNAVLRILEMRRYEP